MMREVEVIQRFVSGAETLKGKYYEIEYAIQAAIEFSCNPNVAFVDIRKRNGNFRSIDVRHRFVNGKEVAIQRHRTTIARHFRVYDERRASRKRTSA